MESIFKFLGTDRNSFLSYGVKLVAILIFLVVAVNAVNFFFRRAERKVLRHGALTGYLGVLRYALLAAVYIAAISIATSAFPAFSGIITSLLAGSGIAAIVLGIACQEPIANLASGLIIIFSKPFKAGDIIRYIEKDISGVVEEITLRHTVIRTFENKRLIIPNGTINVSAIENANYNESKVCMLLDFSITYDSDPHLAMEIISDVVLLHPDYYDNRTPDEITEGEAPVSVLVTKFDTSALVIRAWVWAENLKKMMSMRSDILLGVRRRFIESGIKFAYPHTAVVMENQ